MEWNNKKLNIIDCPGSDDFVGGAITSLNVTDQAVILINGQYGPEVGTQNNFRYTEKLNKPVIFLVNQLDSDKCDFDNLIATMKDIYGSKCVQIQYPIETGSGFNALIDVLLMKKYSWKPEGGAPIIEDIPEEEMDKAMELHAALVEAAAENDEGLMEKFFESESLTEDELREGIRKGLVTRQHSSCILLLPSGTGRYPSRTAEKDTAGSSYLLRPHGQLKLIRLYFRNRRKAAFSSVFVRVIS